jgi:hypothetical protein
MCAKSITEVSEKNKKSEILEAYQELLEQIQKTPTQQSDLFAKPKTEKLSSLTKNSAPELIAGFKIDLNKKVTEISEELEVKVEEIEKLDSDIQIAKNELENIYKIKTQASTLFELIKIEHEKRKEWENAQIEHENFQKQSREDIEIQRKREEETYKFNLEQQRKEEGEKYKERLDQKIDELKEKEKLLDDSLNELENLRTLKDGLEKQIKDAVDKAVKVTTDIITKEHDHKDELDKQKFANEKSILELKIQNLEKENKSLTLELQSLKTQLNKASEQVKDIAVKVIEGRSKSGDESNSKKDEKVF